MKLTVPMNEKVEVDAKIVSIRAKCGDLCMATLHDADGRQIGKERDDYVPGFMPGNHYGDYIILDIDLETGRILNWKTPTPESLIEAFVPDDDE